jgi:hypothetical protein
VSEAKMMMLTLTSTLLLADDDADDSDDTDNTDNADNVNDVNDANAND